MGSIKFDISTCVCIALAHNMACLASNPISLKVANKICAHITYQFKIIHQDNKQCICQKGLMPATYRQLQCFPAKRNDHLSNDIKQANNAHTSELVLVFDLLC